MINQEYDVIVVGVDDIRYFRERYERALANLGEEAAEKYKKQLELLEDCRVIYQPKNKGWPV